MILAEFVKDGKKERKTTVQVKAGRGFQEGGRNSSRRGRKAGEAEDALKMRKQCCYQLSCAGGARGQAARV